MRLNFTSTGDNGWRHERCLAGADRTTDWLRAQTGLDSVRASPPLPATHTNQDPSTESMSEDLHY
ncbi:hypothetical protein J6590_018034 [Homalodisca vitripennis]|nr:hypothetical protein J6590_018034 [Homalodisca vitripennis]